MRILDRIYYRVRKRKVEEGLRGLRTISIKEVYGVISRDCWEFGIEYIIILKDRSILEITIQSNNKKVFLKFHKALIIRENDVISFIEKLNNLEIKNGVYITTGNFSKEAKNILKKEEKVNITVEDGFHFIKRQVWMNIDFNQKLKPSQLNFYMYIPS